jgi:phage terminase large subunit GpA-like protein
MEQYGKTDQKYLYYIVTAWTKNEIKILDKGWTSTFEEIEKIREKFQVKHVRVAVDSGNCATLIYNTCNRFGRLGTIGGKQIWLSWLAFKGSKYTYFKHKEGNQEIKKYYSEEVRIDSKSNEKYQGKTFCRLYHWSNPSIKDIASRIVKNQSNIKLIMNGDDKEFEEMLNVEVKVKVIDKKTNMPDWRWINKSGKPNEAWDCLCMNICQAMMSGIIDI